MDIAGWTIITLVKYDLGFHLRGVGVMSRAWTHWKNTLSDKRFIMNIIIVIGRVESSVAQSTIQS